MASAAQVERPAADFHPSVWGDFFITHVPQPDQVIQSWNEQIQVLKLHVKNMLTTTSHQLTDDQSSETRTALNLVDEIQRLGLDYHFEEEIEQILRRDYEKICPGDGDINSVALRFRLLRQHGYNVSSDVFNKFTKTEEGGEFRKEIAGDVEGMLSLYEAAYLRTQGETILDEALNFTKTHLAAAAAADDLTAERITHALKRPLRKGVKIVEHLFFISIYEQTQGHDEGLLKLAKLTFNVLQNLYQSELRVLTKWWIELGLPKKLTYARDRLVEVYFWAVGCLWEPKFSLARYCFMKNIPIGSMYDDSYDAHGTIQELELFTAAIHRWDIGMTGMKDYMKTLFQAIIDSYDDIHAITSEEFGRSYCWDYGKIVLQNTVTLYLEEARCLDRSLVPTVEEYRSVSSLSTMYQWLAFSALWGMGDDLAPKEVFEWLLTEPRMLVASSDHCRLMDDIMTHEFEQKRGHAASSVECYMKQYGVSRKEAVDALNEMVEEDWKIMNGELLDPPTHIPKQVLSALLGFAQVMDVLYKDADGYTHSGTTTKDMLTALLVTPLPI